MKTINNNKIAIIIPIFHPDRKFKKLLSQLHKQKNVEFDFYILDSGSKLSDYRGDLSGLNYDIIQIDPTHFNHGGTRQKAAIKCRNYKILIYMTQDAVPANEYTIANLVKAFIDTNVGCAYGRQLPSKNASVLAARARIFNYPAVSTIKQMSDAKKLGIKTSFISDSFAAYRTTALQAIGGFPEDVILGEDTYVASKMILAGWKNAYCADAQVYHSHNYSIWQEFQRYFDTGVFHASQPWIRKSFGTAEGEGKKFILSEIKYLLLHRPWLLPSMIIRDGFKFIGYRMGIAYKSLPVGIKRKCSMMPQYWKDH
jgi:rhamnosyltransferase